MNATGSRRSASRLGSACRGRAALVLVLSAGLACTRREAEPEALFADVTGRAGAAFELATGAAGERYLIETMLGGVGWIDYDGDGDWDLYAVNGHSEPREAKKPGRESNRLFENDGAGRFKDVTDQAGVGDTRYGSGVAVGDYDNDGDSDLLVTNFGRNTLYRNDGDGTFSNVTIRAGLAEEGYNMSAAWFDMEGDGDLDLYIARYLVYDPRTSRACQEGGRRVYCHPRTFSGAPDLLYENAGDGTFTEVGARAGIAKAGEYEGKGLGVAVFDFDRDGWTDIYVANDTTPNFLWHSQKDGTFVDIGQEAGAALDGDGKALAGMGVDIADVNRDGLTDIHVTNFALEMNSLYIAASGPRFLEASRPANLHSSFVPLGFGTLFSDIDLDGDEDIVTLNGHVNDQVEVTDPGTGSTYRQRPSLLLNDGGGLFEDAGSRGGPFFAVECIGRGLARADFDGDGDADLAALTLDRSLVLLRNDPPACNRSITVRLVGSRSPRDGYGARIEAEQGGKMRAFEYQSARSYLSASDPRVILGLGTALVLDRLRVIWPSGEVTERRSVPAGSRLVLEEPR